VTSDANCTANYAQSKVVGKVGGYFSLRLSWTDGRPQLRWRDQTLESRLTDIPASMLTIGSTKQLSFNYCQEHSIDGFWCMPCARSVPNASIVCAHLAWTSVMSLSNDSQLFIVTLSMLSYSTLVNPRTAGGGQQRHCSDDELSWLRLVQYKVIVFHQFFDAVNFNLTRLNVFVGTIRYMSSANFVMALTGESGWRLEAHNKGNCCYERILNNACCYISWLENCSQSWMLQKVNWDDELTMMYGLVAKMVVMLCRRWMSATVVDDLDWKENWLVKFR